LRFMELTIVSITGSREFIKHQTLEPIMRFNCAASIKWLR
jgi:hypothetical protein